MDFSEFPDNKQVLEALGANDWMWDEILTQPTEELRSWYDLLTDLLSNLNLASTMHKADWEEYRFQPRPTDEYRERRAQYARWRAEVASVNLSAKKRRDQVSQEMRRRTHDPENPGHGLRLPVYKLASGLLELDQALEADHQTLADEAEDRLISLLDTVEIWADGKAQTLRLWLEGGAKW